jgi:hypothetical protein
MLLALASVVFLGSESLSTRNHILLSQIWDFPFRRLLRLAGPRWRYSTPPSHGTRVRSPHEPYWGHRFLQFFYCKCAYMLPRKRVYLFVLLSPHDPYRSHRFLQFFYCKCAYTFHGNVFTYSFCCPQVKVKVEVTLRLTVSQSVSLGVENHLGLMTRYLLLFDSYGLVWREDGSVFLYAAGPRQRSLSRVWAP